MRPRFRVEINKTKRFPVITLSESPKGFDDKSLVDSVSKSSVFKQNKRIELSQIVNKRDLAALHKKTMIANVQNILSHLQKDFKANKTSTIDQGKHKKLLSLMSRKN